MKDLLISVAVGDIAGMPYEFDNRTKNYDDVQLLTSQSTYTDDTVCTFACAESLLNHTDMATTLWTRCRMEKGRGYGGRFHQWLNRPQVTPPYNSFGNGSAMRVAAAGFMATTSNECVNLATSTVMPTHNHPEGIKGGGGYGLSHFLRHAKQKQNLYPRKGVRRLLSTMDGAFVQGNTTRLSLRRDVPNNRSSSIDLLFRKQRLYQLHQIGHCVGRRCRHARGHRRTNCIRTL